MELHQEVRLQALRAIVSTTPKLLWERLPESVAWAYKEAHASTKHNPLILPPYARVRAAYERHWHVEYVLHNLAKEVGATFTPKVVDENGWRYGVLQVGTIALTQKCTPIPNGRPPVAGFRRQMAVTGGFVRQGNFDFDNGESKIAGAEICAVLLHAPVSRDFASDGFATPAFVNVAVPWADYFDWAVSIDVSEILASYAPMPVVRKNNTPDWKINIKKDGGKEGA